MDICKDRSVAFTGHRHITTSHEEVYKETYKAIVALYDEGYDTFLTGMAEGFDTIAALAVLEIRKFCPEIKLIAVIPFPGQPYHFSSDNQKKYKTILEAADKTVTIAEEFFKDIFLRRNDYLLANSSAVICYYSGQRGGTMYTYNRAVAAGMDVINVFKS